MLKIEIEKMVYGGQGMGHVDGKVVFVPFTAPGDRVEAEVIKEKKDYAEAVLMKIESGSRLRVTPFCPLFGQCGGCQYQHLPYPEQLKAKEEALKDALDRLRRKRDFEILPIIPSSHDRGYRIRAQFKGGIDRGRPILGFYAWRTHRVLEVEECPLLYPMVNRILKGLRDWITETKEVWVKGADIQVSPEEGRGVVGLRVEGPCKPETVQDLAKGIPAVKGVIVEGKQKISQGDLTLSYDWPGVLGGKGLRIRSSGGSFVQVNPYQNFTLMQKVVEWANLKGQEKVIDLYCGSGNLTLPLAQGSGMVWGVDQDGQAIDYAVENARENNLPHCQFIAASAQQGIREVWEQTESVDLVVLDPPRVGAREALDPLVLLRPRKILYVSCEPPTLARDLGRLEVLGYHVNRVQPLDMFPQTYHLEVIAECRWGNRERS